MYMHNFISASDLLCIFDVDVLVVGSPLIIKPVPMGDVPPPPGTVSGRRTVIVDVREVTPLPLWNKNCTGRDIHIEVEDRLHLYAYTYIIDVCIKLYVHLL